MVARVTGEWGVTESGSGDPLVLVHGLGTDNTAWDRVAPLLARSFRVIAVDLPGYALNSAVDVVPSGNELATGLEALLGDMGIGSAVFVGHSFGGAVALLAAHYHPARCAGLALIAPGGFGVELNPVVPFMGTRAGAAMLRALYRPRASRTIERIARRVETNGAAANKVRISELMETYDRLRTEQARAQFRASVRESLALSATIDRAQIAIDAQIPILVLWGREDRVLPPWQAKNVSSMLPWSTVRMLDGRGHTPHRSDPSTVAREIAAFAESGDVIGRRGSLLHHD
jgi:pimeloyl-ACP methyl ester carboxylesterase